MEHKLWNTCYQEQPVDELASPLRAKAFAVEASQDCSDSCLGCFYADIWRSFCRRNLFKCPHQLRKPSPLQWRLRITAVVSCASFGVVTSRWFATVGATCAHGRGHIGFECHTLWSWGRGTCFVDRSMVLLVLPQAESSEPAALPLQASKPTHEAWNSSLIVLCACVFWSSFARGKTSISSQWLRFCALLWRRLNRRLAHQLRPAAVVSIGRKCFECPAKKDSLFSLVCADLTHLRHRLCIDHAVSRSAFKLAAWNQSAESSRGAVLCCVRVLYMQATILLCLIAERSDNEQKTLLQGRNHI